jgi:hypothetical protein
VELKVDEDDEGEAEAVRKAAAMKGKSSTEAAAVCYPFGLSVTERVDGNSDGTGSASNIAEGTWLSSMQIWVLMMQYFVGFIALIYFIIISGLMVGAKFSSPEPLFGNSLNIMLAFSILCFLVHSIFVYKLSEGCECLADCCSLEDVCCCCCCLESEGCCDNCCECDSCCDGDSCCDCECDCENCCECDGCCDEGCCDCNSDDCQCECNCCDD